MNHATRHLRAILAAGALLLAPAAAHAQVVATAPVVNLPSYSERVDLFGGAMYGHFNPGVGSGSQVSANNLAGWNGSATVWFRPPFGLVFSLRGLYGNMNLTNAQLGLNYPKMSEHLFFVGPDLRFVRRPSYAAGFHVLIGGTYGNFDKSFPSGIQPSQVRIYKDKLAYAMAIGSSIDYNLSPKWALRAIPDWQPTHFGYSWQNEFAGSFGVVYKLGSVRR